MHAVCARLYSEYAVGSWPASASSPAAAAPPPTASRRCSGLRAGRQCARRRRARAAARERPEILVEREGQERGRALVGRLAGTARGGAQRSHRDTAVELAGRGAANGPCLVLLADDGRGGLVRAVAARAAPSPRRRPQGAPLHAQLPADSADDAAAVNNSNHGRPSVAVGRAVAAVPHDGVARDRARADRRPVRRVLRPHADDRVGADPAERHARPGDARLELDARHPAQPRARRARRRLRRAGGALARR